MPYSFFPLNNSLSFFLLNRRTTFGPLGDQTQVQPCAKYCARLHQMKSWVPTALKGKKANYPSNRRRSAILS